MGPRKMKRFIIDALNSSKPIDQDETAIGATEPENDNAPCPEITGNDTGAEKLPGEERPQQRMPNSIDYDGTTFACRMCRTVLLDENHLAEFHTQNQHSFKERSNHQAGNGKSRCQSLFCDESVLEWLAPPGMEYDVQGKLACPRCSFKVGHWNWSGAQSPCGTWVVPAIQIPLGKIDVVLPLSERRLASAMAVVTPRAM
jgi:dual specificity phosphatase 12